MGVNLTTGKSWSELAHAHRYRVSHLAAALGVDPRTLERRFQDQLRVSPEQAMEKYRLARALQLLQQGQLSIKEVSDELGFSVTSTFCRAFKKWLGMTPVGFRELFVSH